MHKKKKGELIEPLKPIVYYIDPLLRKMENYQTRNWRLALKNAGWKNAIRGEARKWSNNEFRRCSFSVLRYFAADIQNAYGPNVHDPRTGEILESHIGWYHNIMSL
jgi:hypothetical protein